MEHANGGRTLPGQLLEETASVLVAMHEALESGHNAPLWLTAFGAGFSAHSCRMARAA